jgi:hypothetical protein
MSSIVNCTSILQRSAYECPEPFLRCATDLSQSQLPPLATPCLEVTSVFLETASNPLNLTLFFFHPPFSARQHVNTSTTDFSPNIIVPAAPLRAIQVANCPRYARIVAWECHMGHKLLRQLPTSRLQIYTCVLCPWRLKHGPSFVSLFAAY